MPSDASQLERFISRTRRRWAAVRLVEAVGLCSLAGSGASLLLAPLMLWQGQPVAGLVAGLLLGSVPAGVLIGVARRPSRMKTAIEVDRQLRSDELLSSALELPADDSTFSRAVLAMAEARVRGVSPSVLVLNRLGARAWGGIGLSAALVLTLSLLATQPSASQARQPGAANPATSFAERDAFDARSRPPQDLTPRERRPLQDFKQEPLAREVLPAEADLSGADAVASRTTDSRGSTGGQGTGAGRAETDRPQHAPSPSPAATSADGERGGVVSSGAGVSTAGGGAPGAPGSAARPDHRPATPWSSPQWSQAREAALQQVRSNRVPQAYHDLVRAYFGRDATTPR